MTRASSGASTIVSAEALRVRIPFRRPFVTSAGSWHVRHAWIVRLRDAAGRSGVGEASLAPSADPGELTALADAVRTVVPGLVAAGSIDRLPTSEHESADPVRLALQAEIVGAALDLGLLPWAHTVTPTGSVRVNATIATEELGASVAGASEAVDGGFTCIKIKGGSEGTTEALVERLAAVRATVGPDIELRLDVNGAWDATTARLRLAALADLDLAYVEQPIPAGDVPSLVGLRRGSPVRIAADESVVSRSAARALLDAGAADVLVVKPARVGGALEALAIAGDAAEAGVGVTISTLLETGVGLMTAVHVAAAVPGDPRHAHGLATADVLVADLLATPLSMTFGRISLPDRLGPGEPGFGIALDDAALDQWTVERIGTVA